jgi:DNA-binding transcriptional LysR family regulator
MLSRYMRAGELELVMDHTRSQPGEIHAVWPHTHYLPSKTRAAIDALVAEIPAMLGEKPGHPLPVSRPSRAFAA